jgi:hypothetical protein
METFKVLANCRAPEAFLRSAAWMEIWRIKAEIARIEAELRELVDAPLSAEEERSQTSERRAQFSRAEVREAMLSGQFPGAV